MRNICQKEKMPKIAPKTESMEELVEKAGSGLIPYKAGDVIEVEILAVSKAKILADVQGVALGIIPAREFSTEMSDLKAGNKVLAYVLVEENEDGNVVLSLRRADRERIYKILDDKLKEGQPLTIKVTGANKGGLLVEFGSAEGFLPVSQLAASHYPRVRGDQQKILNHLQSMVGQSLRAKILTYERSQNKLIFSEKEAGDLEQEEKAKELKVGQRISGVVTGIVDFGIFVKLDLGSSKSIEGLVHISEISWGKVTDLKKLYQVGQEVEVEVIEISGGKISLSVKRLKKDPLREKIGEFKKGQVLEGKVTKVSPFGAFVEIEEGLEGLVHISNLGKDIKDPKEKVKEGGKYQFKILEIQVESRKISLELVGEKKRRKATKPKVKKAEANEN